MREVSLIARIRVDLKEFVMKFDKKNPIFEIFDVNIALAIFQFF